MNTNYISSSSFSSSDIEHELLITFEDLLKNLLSISLHDFNNTYKRVHMIPGSFLKLCDLVTFNDLIYPGINSEIIHSNNLPSNFLLLLKYNLNNLNKQKIISNSLSVINGLHNNYKEKMHQSTKELLTPQILLESLSNHLIELMQSLVRKFNQSNAQNLQFASEMNSKYFEDLIEEDNLAHLRANKFCVQQNFLGYEWLEVLRNDLERYSMKGKFTSINFNGSLLISTSSSSSQVSSSYAEISWIDLTQEFMETYPALSEVIEQIHSIPYYLNKNYGSHSNFYSTSSSSSSSSSSSILDSYKLLVPSKGFTMLTKIPRNNFSTLRIDSMNNGNDKDSCIRLTCNYYIKRAPNTSSFLTLSKDNRVEIIDEASLKGKIIFSNEEILPSDSLVSPTTTSSNFPMTSKNEIDLEDDLLTIHYSSEKFQERLPDTKNEWFCLTFYIQGRVIGKDD